MNLFSLHPLWWLIGTFGLGTAVVIVLAIMGLWPLIIGTKLGRYAIAIFTLGIGLFWIYETGAARGQKALRQKEADDNEAFLNRVGEADRDLADKSDDELGRLLGQRPRDPNARGQGG